MLRKRFEYLEMLRAICALAVLVNHLYSKTLDLPQNPIFNMLFAFATEAVICFFVLSGCVIGLQNYAGIKSYVIARITRIAPVYYVALLFTVFAMILCGQAIDLAQLAGNILFLQDGHLTDPFVFNVPMWSLAYEMFYYFAFILILVKPSLIRLLFVASVFVGISLYFVKLPGGVLAWFQNIYGFFCCWLLGVFAVQYFRNGRFLSIETGVFLFVVGVCLSRAPLSTDYFDFARLFSFAVGSAALCSALLAAEQKFVPSTALDLREIRFGLGARLAVCGLSLAMLWRFSPSLIATKAVMTAAVVATALTPALAVQIGQLFLRPARGVLVYVGGLSFALYVIHYPIIYLFNNLSLGLSPIAKVCVAAVLAFASAHVLDYWFQPRIKSFVRNKLRRGIVSEVAG
jgi:peptidoglycan/LPS O-acetylase OafA/YrhL